MKELIKKTEIQTKTLLEIINHPETTEAERKKAMACRRFVVGFLFDLRKIIKRNIDETDYLNLNDANRQFIEKQLIADADIEVNLD